MNKLAALAPLAIAFVSACTCGGYTGGGDRVLARGNDMLILCENGGFYANVTTGAAPGVVEGFFATDDAGTVTGLEGDDGQPAFTLTWSGDGGATTSSQGAGDVTVPAVGDGVWTENQLNEVELDHANIICTDIESRSWWGQGA